MPVLRRRVHKRLTAFIAVFALLFAQMALASYLCPVQSGSMDLVQMMDASVPCEGMDESQPALCHEHCAEEGATSEAVQIPASAAPALVRLLLLPVVYGSEPERLLPSGATPTGQPPPRPLFLSTLRLRV
jgi:hypothetical protein